MQTRDPSLDNLLALDGESFTADAEGMWWVKFEARTCPLSPQRPHGIKYALTLHDASGHRVVGFDNAHPISEGNGPGARTRIEYDHKHLGPRVRFYDYRDAGTLVADFWEEVDKILQQRSSGS